VNRNSQPLNSALTELSVGGMTCNNCVRHVSEAAQGVPGVARVVVSLEHAQAIVHWQAGFPPNESAVSEAIRSAGFEPKLARTKTELQVKGMTCSGCVRAVMEALRGVTGVASADVQLEGARATVQWQPGVSPDEHALVNAAQKAGYEAELLEANDRQTTAQSWSPLAGWRFNVVVGSILTAPLLLAEWVFQVGMERWYHWLAFALALPVQILCGARFYRGAWSQIKAGNSNMDTLVVLGSSTAFAYSAWGLFSGWHGHLFFMESASIITLISLGHWFEAKASARAEKSLKSLLNLAPPLARLLGPDGVESEVQVTRLRTGDSIALKPGDRVPIDGEVVEGASTLDESMLTGESLPVEKTKDSKVFAGTLNVQSWLQVRVTATGDGTALAHIISIVQRAQSSRAHIQRLGDRVSSVFVPVVVLIALATGLWWGLAPDSARAASAWLGMFLWPAHHPEGILAAAIYHAAAVLIIACPCAMGLATPVAIMAGANAAAERGILIRDGVALEKAGQITAILFDKTGTITEGRVTVAALEDLQLAPQLSNAMSTANIAASLAKPSSHPLSQAVAGIAEATLATVDWREIPGSGVQAKLETADGLMTETTFQLGSLNWFRECGVDLTPGTKFSQSWSGQGATVVGIAADKRLLGVVALQDRVKRDTAEIIRQLQRQGKSVYLVTGDNKQTAQAIATQVGIANENVFAEIRPAGKAGIVQELQQRGQKVAFIGDGINDAPALEQADLGIAVSRASDVAREAADIILLSSDIQAVPEALGLAQATLRTIKQNLFWAFFYNAAGIPLAMFGFLSPILSALAMGLSDLIVIGNALRLRRWGR
jgi:Cu+-exporting ATPase